jgi:hypothetical protein
MKSNFFKALLFLACFSSFLLFPINNLLAQDDPYGIDDMDLYLEQDLQPREAIVGIINIVLSFLGLIAVIIVIYGGFVWMTSGGDADKINKAKKIFKNGLIGLVIILLSWGIVVWVLGMFNGGGGTSNITDPVKPPFEPGWGVIGSCTLESVYPEPNQKEVPRNTSIIISFKEVLDLNSVCVTEKGGDISCACGSTDCQDWINPNNIKIEASHQENNLINAKAQLTEDQKTIVVVPQEFLGTSNHFTDYIVAISGFLKDDGNNMFQTCSYDQFSWTFEVSDIIDLSPPKVISAGIFPPPDNERDNQIIVDSQKASGQIQVNNCPTAYRPGEVISASPVGDSASISDYGIDSNYSENYTQLTLTALTGGQVQLKAAEVSLGVSTWQNNKVIFPNFYNLSLELEENYEVGNQWNIEVQSRILADTLTVGSFVYSFTETGLENNSIAVPSPCNLNIQAENIFNIIETNPSVSSNLMGTTINITAVVGGSSGNAINLSTSNSEALGITAMSGGINEGSYYEVLDKADQPRNTTIQINFNKPMNPITLSGSSSNLEDSLKIVDLDNNEEIIDGTFYISNNYRTVEFISDFQCGENACGEKIYCLPDNSHIEVRLIAASLKSCNSNNDCMTYQPFINCSTSVFAFNVCQDGDGNYLPSSEGFLGIMDTSFNSLDGNRDSFAKGPNSFYYENIGDINDGDNFKWNFFVTDQINLDPPRINSVFPVQGASFNGQDDIIVEFDSLMRNSTLRTGSVFSSGPLGVVEHKRINIYASDESVGYWIKTENIDSNNSGSPDYTQVLVNHSELSPSTTWRSQVGSGVENIYQNCFKPSAGVTCNATESQPSCCFNNPTNVLNQAGNCP